MSPERLTKAHRHWGKLLYRMFQLRNRQPQATPDLVRASYDRIAAGYDEAWTHHMRDLSLQMLDRMNLPKGGVCVDLTCGTGFITKAVFERTGGSVVGVDNSEGMLVSARTNAANCSFIQSDIVAYLESLGSQTVDVVTCGWGLGYSRPGKVIREIHRVLRSGGQVGIIDNSLLSLAEVLWSSMLAFAERPAALTHVMKVRFLPSASVLAILLRWAGLRVLHSGRGAKTYFASSGRQAIERLTATGAAAGFEFAVDEGYRDEIFSRFAEIMEERYGTQEGVPITHRYLWAIGAKK